MKKNLKYFEVLLTCIILSARELIPLIGVAYLKARCLDKATSAGEASFHLSRRHQMLPLHHITSIEMFCLKMK